tara:strand:- start:85961 stop:86119 length:159 start_codon:yes stop_codon:yes gene_type:complete
MRPAGEDWGEYWKMEIAQGVDMRHNNGIITTIGEETSQHVLKAIKPNRAAKF